MKVHKFMDAARKTDRDYVESLSVCLNEHDNGGEAVTLAVDVYDNGDGPPHNIYYNIKLQTHCYGTSQAEIFLGTVDLEIIKEAIDTLIKEIKGKDGGTGSPK